jgi:DNA repair photolyase
MGAKGLARAFVSVTTLDRKLARAMEPRAATPERRLEALATLRQAGAEVGVLFAPVIPGLNDHELEAVLARAAQAGATTASYVVLRLPLEIKDLFREWLEEARPDRAKRVMSLVRQMRGGKDYDAEWGQRMKGQGPIADLIRQRFDRAKAALGLSAERTPLRTDLFRVPPKAGDQLGLFE